MIKRGLAICLGALACLLWGQGADAQVMLNGTANNSSVSGPNVVGSIISTSTGTGVTVAVDSSGSVTLTNGTFAHTSVSTGTATYNSGSFTASCVKTGSTCNGTHTVTISAGASSGSPGVSAITFNLTQGAITGGCSGVVTTNNTNSVKLTLSSCSNNGWSAAFTLGMTATFSAVGAGPSTGTSNQPFSVTVN